MSELPPALSEHLLNPRGAGRPPQFDGVGEGSNPACGDELRLYLTREGDGLRLAFEARACGAVLATASYVIAELDGAPQATAAGYDVRAAVERAGGLPRHRSHAARVVQRALDGALAALSPRG